MISIIGGDGKEYGPVPFEQLKRWLAEGRVTMDTLARRAGETTWIKISELPELQPGYDAAQSTLAQVPELPASDGFTPSVTESDSEASDSTTPALPLASLSSRMAAALIDGTISMIFALPGLFMLLGEILQGGGGIETLNDLKIEEHPASVAAIMIGMIIPAVVQMTLLTLRGQSLGKLVLRIRIVQADTNEAVGFFRAVFLRGFIPGILGSLPFVGYIFSLLDIAFIYRSDRRCIHDLIANTKVIDLNEVSR